MSTLLYRQKLYKAFSEAAAVPSCETNDMLTEQTRVVKMYKQRGGCLGNQFVQRWVKLTPEGLEQCDSNGAGKTKKIALATTTSCESRRGVKAQYWHDSKCEYRAVLLGVRPKGPIWVYSNDLHFLHYLRAQATKVGDLKQVAEGLSLVKSAKNFEKFNNQALDAIQFKVKQHQHFGRLAPILIEVARYSQKNQRATSDLLDRIFPKGYSTNKSIYNTFKVGSAKPKIRDLMPISSIFAMRLQQLATQVKLRRLSRSLEAREELAAILQKDTRGYDAAGVIIASEQGETILKDTRVRLHKKMIEFEDFKARRRHYLPLDEVTFIATDLLDDYQREAQMALQSHYKIEIFAAAGKLSSLDYGGQNNAPELDYNTPFLVSSGQNFGVTLSSLTLPKSFFELKNDKCFVKVVLTQRSPDGSKEYTTSSKYKFLSVGRMEWYRGDSVSVAFEDTLIFKSLLDDPNETFQLSIYYSLAQNPVPIALLDYLCCFPSNAFHSEPMKYEEFTQSVILKVHDEPSKVAKVKVKVAKIDQTSTHCPYVSGKRILVGRYCILKNGNDGKPQVCQVLQYNRENEGSLILRDIKTHKVIDRPIPLSLVRPVEQYGVSVYNYERGIPDELETTRPIQHWRWKCTLNTMDKQLLNKITDAIRNQHASQHNQKKGLLVDPITVQGHLSVSILKAMQIGAPEKVCVKIQDQTSGPIDEGIDIRKTLNAKSKVQTFKLGVYPQMNNQIQLTVTDVENNLVGECSFDAQAHLCFSPNVQFRKVLVRLNGEVTGTSDLVVLFQPDLKTIMTNNLWMGQQKTESPLAALQIDSGMQVELHDQFGYRVPLGKYCWLASKQSKVELGLLQNNLGVLLASIRQKNSKLDPRFTKLICSDFEETKSLCDNNYMTHQEAYDIELQKQNHNRPAKSPYTTNFENRWAAQRNQFYIQGIEEYNFEKWTQMMERKPEEKVSKFDRWASSGNDNLNQDIKDQIHSMTIVYGIPSELRVTVWKKFLRESKVNMQDFRVSDVDSLTFKQIDEDLKYYKFPKGYLSKLTDCEREKQILAEKCQIREVLRALVTYFQKQKKTFAYSSHTIDILQLLLRTTKGVVEDAFQIMVGLVTRYSEPFLLSGSSNVLFDDHATLMRKELSTFKLLVKYFLPELYDKFHKTRLQIEFLVHGSILNFYAHSFSTAIVMRLWDLIFYQLHSERDAGRCVWYILTPAFMILKHFQKEMLQAKTSTEIINLVKNSGTLWYDPYKFGRELLKTIEDLFSEKIDIVKNGCLVSLLGGISQSKNPNAHEMENERYEKYKKATEYFTPIRKANKGVSDLAGDQHKEIISDILTKFQTSQRNPNHETKTLHLFLHSLASLPMSKEPTFKVRIVYQTPGATRVIEAGEFTQKSLNFYAKIDNQDKVTFQVYDSRGVIEEVSMFSCTEKSKFCHRQLVLTNLVTQNQPRNHMFSKNFLNLMTFVEVHQAQETPQEEGLALIISSYKRQKPGVNISYKPDDLKTMPFSNFDEKFKNYVEQEFQALLKILNSEEQARDSIDDLYNFSETAECQRFDEQKFFDIMKSLSGQFRNIEKFVKQSFTMFSQITGNNGETTTFCFRRFLTSLVLSSFLTVSEKVSALFDFEVAATQATEGKLKLDSIRKIVQLVLETNQFQIEKTEAKNICELIFASHPINRVLDAVWTENIDTYSQKQNLVTFSGPLDGGVNLRTTNYSLKSQVETAIRQYTEVYGNKNIDFNPRTSPFSRLEHLIGVKDAAEIAKSYEQCVTIVLTLQIDSEISSFYLVYENQQLTQVNSPEPVPQQQTEVKTIEDYFRQNRHKAFLEDDLTLVTKEHFLKKMYKVPLFDFLLKSQTLTHGQDAARSFRVENLKQKVSVSVFLERSEFQFDYVPQSEKVVMPGYWEGLIYHIYDLKNTSVLSELRQIIVTQARNIVDKKVNPKDGLKKLTEDQAKELQSHIPQLQGQFKWLYYNPATNEWSQSDDFKRISDFLPENQKQINLKLERVFKHDLDLQFDCLSYYKHSDQSHDWLACRLVRREAAQGTFTLEFKHLAKYGPSHWVKRFPSEILFSAQYTRCSDSEFVNSLGRFVRKAYQ